MKSLQRWAREGALPLPPRPLPRPYAAAFLLLRIIPGDKAFNRETWSTSPENHETETRGHFYCGMT
jgi:hypothetical protein